MKLKNCGLIACITLVGWLTIGCSIPLWPVKGNGKIVTKQIEVTDYLEIEAENGGMTVIYTQATGNPTLEVTVDENILELYQFEVKNTKLTIQPVKKHRNSKFSPTEFTVKTSSRQLVGVKASGSIEFIVQSPLKTDVLNLDLAGSSNVHLNEIVEFKHMDLSLSGSTNVSALALGGENLRADMAGSNKLTLAGYVSNAQFKIAGSGTVNAYELKTDDVACDIAGSGKINVSVKNSIDADIAGSGKINYKGNPKTVNSSVAGAGNINKIE